MGFQRGLPLWPTQSAGGLYSPFAFNVPLFKRTPTGVPPPEPMTDDDRAGELGPIDLPALQRIRDLWLELDPLVDATELQISRSDGFGDAESARFDIQWSELGMYSFHDVDSDDGN